MKSLYSILACICICTFMQGQNNIQQKDTTTIETIYIDEVIVVGDIKKDPIHTTVVNNYADKIVQPKNVADLFNNINGFSSVKRGNYAIDPSFRASQYEQLNIQYDGGTKAMHACPNRMDPITTHIIPEEISTIEIIKGPYTVRYGSSFGGIINLVTQKANSNAYGFHGKASAGYETNGNSFVNMLHLQHANKKLDVTGNIGYRNFGDYKDGNQIKIPSSFKSTDYGIRFGINLNDKNRLQTHFRQSFGRDILHAALPMDTDFDNSTIVSIDYKSTNIGNTLKTLSSKLYYSYVDHLMTNYSRPSFKKMEAHSSVNATTIGGKIELAWLPLHNMTLYTGIDAQHINRDGSRNRLVKVNMAGMPLPAPVMFTDKIWQDAYINDFGIFTEAKWAVNTSTILTTGVRYDWVNSDIRDPESDFSSLYNLKKRSENLFSGTLSVKKIIADNVTLEAAYGRGIRPANMIERYINHFTVGQDPYEYVGNPNLKAEINNQFEIGCKGVELLTGVFNKFSYSASFYYSFFNNYIIAVIDPTLTRKFNPTTPPIHPKVFKNVDKAYKTGFEMSATTNFLNYFYVKGEIAYVYTKNKDLNEALPLTMPFTSRFWLGIEKQKFWANVQYNITTKQDHIAPSFGEYTSKGYETLDIRMGIKPLKNITLGIAALNIFDKAYNNHLNFSFTNQEDFTRVPVNDPGRNITAFLQYTF